MDTCSAPAPVLMPYFSSFYVKVNSDPEVVFLALWRVGVHAEWRSAHSRLQLSLFALGIWTICFEPLVSGSYCSLFGVWRNAWFDNGYMFCVSRMAFGSIYNLFLRDWVDSAPEVDSGDAPIARLLFLEICTLFL